MIVNATKIPVTDEEAAEGFRIYIENEVLKIISQNVDNGVPKEKIQAMAKHALNIIKPGLAVDELYQAVATLDDQYPEFAPVVYNVMKKYEQKYEKRAIDQVSAMVKAGKYMEAENMVKKVLAYKMLY